MIKLKNSGIIKQVNLWSDVEINKHIQQERILDILEQEINVETWNKWVESSYLIELCIKNKPASNYAKLGMKYMNTNTDTLVVKVYIGYDEGIILENTIATLGDEVHSGIPKEYGEEILRKATHYLIKNGCSTGELIFNIGAHGYYGSSQSIFGVVTLILIRLLNSQCGNIEELEKELKNIISSIS